MTCLWLQPKAGPVAGVVPPVPAQGDQTERRPGLTWAGRMCWPQRKVDQHPVGPPQGWALFREPLAGSWGVKQNVSYGLTEDML